MYSMCAIGIYYYFTDEPLRLCQYIAKRSLLFLSLYVLRIMNGLRFVAVPEFILGVSWMLLNLVKDKNIECL